jgi:hypothetical protein
MARQTAEVALDEEVVQGFSEGTRGPVAALGTCGGSTACRSTT